MRGRTNIPPRVSVTVNGDIINATVETGSVSVGDFVEYKTVTGLSEVGNDEYEVIKELIRNSYKVVLKLSGTTCKLELYNLTSGILLSSLTYTVNNASDPIDFDFLSDTEIVLLLCNGTNGIINYIEIYSSALVKRSSITSDFGQYSKPFAICSIGSTSYGNTFIVLNYNYSTTDKSFVYYVSNKTCRYLNNIEVDLGDLGGANELLGASAVFIPGNNDGRIMIVSKSSNYSQGSSFCSYYLKLLEVTIGNDVSFSVIKSYTGNLWQTSTNAPNAFNEKFCRINDNVIGLVSFGYSTSRYSDTGWIERMGIFSYNLSSDDVSLVYNLDLKTIALLSTTPELNQTTSDKVLLNANITMIENNLIGFMAYGKSTSSGELGNILCLLKWDDSTSTYEITDKKYISNSPLIGWFIVKYGSNIKFYYRSKNTPFTNYLRTYLISNYVLQEMVDKNYVKVYAGGNQIGFSKNAGVTGSEIQIYVPYGS